MINTYINKKKNINFCKCIEKLEVFNSKTSCLNTIGKNKWIRPAKKNPNGQLQKHFGAAFRKAPALKFIPCKMCIRAYAKIKCSEIITRIKINASLPV